MHTKECIEEIISNFKENRNEAFFVDKNWKRISKKGTDTIVRRFENRITKDIVEVKEYMGKYDITLIDAGNTEHVATPKGGFSFFINEKALDEPYKESCYHDFFKGVSNLSDLTSTIQKSKDCGWEYGYFSMKMPEEDSADQHNILMFFRNEEGLTPEEYLGTIGYELDEASENCYGISIEGHSNVLAGKTLIKFLKEHFNISAKEDEI